MTDDKGRLWIYPKGWERFQGRRDRPGLPWFRVYSDLAADDDWNELSTSDRCLLLGIWMDTNRLGLGRVSANLGTLRARHSVRKGSLERLIQAGLIEVSTTKGAPTGHQTGALEEKRGEKTPKGLLSSTPGKAGSLAATAARRPTTLNGQPRKPSPTELDSALRPLNPDDEPAPLRDAKGYLI